MEIFKIKQHIVTFLVAIRSKHVFDLINLSQTKHIERNLSFFFCGFSTYLVLTDHWSINVTHRRHQYLALLEVLNKIRQNHWNFLHIGADRRHQRWQLDTGVTSAPHRGMSTGLTPKLFSVTLLRCVHMLISNRNNRLNQWKLVPRSLIR